MAEDNSMSAEKPTGAKPDQVGIPSDIRQGRIEERKAGIEDDFGADVERLAVLAHIESEIDDTAIGDKMPSHRFPLPEELLASYQDLPDNRRKDLKRGMNRSTEGAIKTVAIRLADDVRTLRLDQGNTRASADEEVEGIINPTADGKRREFGRMGKTAQMRAIQDLSELRARLLRENAGTYIYFLSSVSEEADIPRDEIENLRRRLEASQDEERLRVAAETRGKALRAMDTVARVNLERLAAIEMKERGTVFLADELADDFSFASLPAKGKIIEKIIGTKVELSLSHIHDIHRLRRLLEHDLSLEEAQLNPEGDLEQQDLLSREVDRIEELIREKLALKTSNLSLGELHISEMRDSVAALSKQLNDLSLSDTFDRIFLLRAGVSEITDN